MKEVQTSWFRTESSVSVNVDFLLYLTFFGGDSGGVHCCIKCVFHILTFRSETKGQFN